MQCSRRSWGVYPEIWQTCAMTPCRPVNDLFIIFFFCQIFLLCSCGKMWVLSHPKCERTDKTKPSSQRFGRCKIEHACETSLSISSKRRGCFIVCAVKVRYSASPRNCLVSLIFSYFGRAICANLGPYAVGSSNVFVTLSTNIPWNI